MKPILSRSIALTCLFLLPSAAVAKDQPDQHPGAIWAAGPLEVVLSFPNADNAILANADPAGKTIACYDGDVKALPTSARMLGKLSIGGAKPADGGRTLTLAIDPQHVDGSYFILLAPDLAPGYSLSGVETAWFAVAEPDAEPTWTGWQPTLDPVASQNATRGSVPHERWFADLVKPGQLRLETQIRPIVGKGRLTIETSAPMVDCFFGDGEPEDGIEETKTGGSRVSLLINDVSAPLFLSMTVETGTAQAPPTIRALFRADDGGDPRELLRDDLLLPWASPAPPPASKSAVAIPDLAGGDPNRGREIFFGDEALCSRCHTFGGEGTAVGPDLTEIRSQSTEEIYRSIAAPSEEIALEYVSYTVALKDGRIAVGVVRAEGFDRIRVVDTEAKSTSFPRDEIDQIRPASTSIMPAGLAPALGERKLRDLIAFLKRGAGGEAATAP